MMDRTEMPTLNPLYHILEQYGTKDGEVYIDANGIYKLLRHGFNGSSSENTPSFC